MIHEADVNDTHLYHHAQVEWDPVDERFRVYLKGHDGRYYYDADAPEDWVRSREQLLAWAAPHVKWTDKSYAALRAAVRDRHGDLVEPFPHIAQLLERVPAPL